MASARLTTIAAEIASLIDAMTTQGGYYYAWATPNVTDAARRTAWPLAVIEYTKDEAVDGIDGLYGFHNAEFIITVDNKITPSTTTQPALTANDALDKALADLQKLFHSNNTGYLPLSGEAVIRYVSSEKIKGTRQNTYHPVRLVTTWNVFYHNS
jgi:hypothetical protein